MPQAYLDQVAVREFYLNVVGCKVDRTLSNDIRALMFYLNVVGCKEANSSRSRSYSNVLSERSGM